MKRFWMLLLGLFPVYAEGQPLATAVRTVVQALSFRDSIRFSHTPAPVYASPVTAWYHVPADSVPAILYDARVPDIGEPWLRRPTFTVPGQGTPDSVLGSPRTPAGWYLGIHITEGTIYYSFRRKANLNWEFINLQDRRLLTVTNDAGVPLAGARVLLGKTRIAYDPTQGGFPLPAQDGMQRVFVRWGDDVQLLQYSYQSRGVYRPDYRAAERPSWNASTFEGYLVTNKPVYGPGDTLRYKAYLIDPRTHRPATGPVAVRFQIDYNRDVVVHPALQPAAPGVYFDTFVLGDSVRMDRLYDLRMEQSKDGAVTAISQRFKTEDYGLQNLFFRVRGEDFPLYQPGDSIHLWTHAYDVSGLPLTDGTLRLTVLPTVTTLPDRLAVVPDTLYQLEAAVSATGETRLSVPTAAFPDAPLQLTAVLRLQTAAGEVRDTSFALPFTRRSLYIRTQVTGDTLRAVLICNKAAVAGTGTLSYTESGQRVQRDVRFPLALPLTGRMGSLTLLQAEADAVTVYLPDDSLQLFPDYDRDTAVLVVRNPQRALWRYAWYTGDALGGYGQASGDTVLRFPSAGGKTVTVLSEHFWGSRRSIRTPIYKWDRRLNLALTKQDPVFPGQRDTVGVALTDVDGVPVPKTNVTVLAFNAQFAEDFTPQLEYRGFLKPSLAAPSFAASLDNLNPRSDFNAPLTDPRWLRTCGLDTAWFYTRVHTSYARLVRVSYPAPDGATRFAVYLQNGASYRLPAVVSVDDAPVYYSFAQSGQVVEALPATAGVHRLQLRFAYQEIALPDAVLEKGRMNVFFLRETAPLLGTVRTSKNSYLDGLDQYTARQHVQAYALEPGRGSDAFVGQDGVALAQLFPNTTNLVGPIRPDGPLEFFQYGNTRMVHEPEPDEVLSFRKGMTRVRNVGGTLLQSIALQEVSGWPQFAVEIPPPVAMDTLGRALFRRVAKRSPVVAPTIEKAEVQLAAAPVPDSLQAWNARLELFNRTLDGIRAVALRGDRGDEVYVQPGLPQQWYLRPGCYSITLLLAGNQTQTLKPVCVRANASVYVPVDSVPVVAVRRQLPAWLQAYAVAAPEPRPFYHASSKYRRTGEKYGRVEGTVLEARTGEPLIDAAVFALQGGLTRDGGVTDVNGHYSLDLPVGRYDIKVGYVGHATTIIEGVAVAAGKNVTVRILVKEDAGRTDLSEVRVSAARRYAKPLIEPTQPGSRSVLSAQEIEKMPVRDLASQVATTAGVLKNGRDANLNISGGRSENTVVIIDGILQTSSGASRTTASAAGEPDLAGILAAGADGRESDGDAPPPQAGASFLNAFLANMNAASGLRKSFRDWAIWEPNLWTGADGKAQFFVNYPDNITAWKTYVLAMNERGFSGRSMTLTRAYKPLSAQLYVPRFLRYGDTVEAVTKLLNYTAQPFDVQTYFRETGRPDALDSVAVVNARSKAYTVAAPAQNRSDTASMDLTYALTLPNGYTDGEERSIPVFPQGVVENRGQLYKFRRDTAVVAAPDTPGFAGVTRITLDDGILGLMLREIESLKEYPYGCTEQLTTKLLAISYEEEIKRAQGKKAFNNTAARKAIISKLAKAQNSDGSFGWFSGKTHDLRITNYVLSTMERIGDKAALGAILQSGYGFLAGNLYGMTPQEQLTALSTLSAGKAPVNFPDWVARLRDTLRTDWERLTLARICGEQGLSCNDLLDSLAAARLDSLGKYRAPEADPYRYDWYRNSYASDVLAYRVFSAVPRYRWLGDTVLDRLLFPAQSSRPRSTAESGLLLSAVVPRLVAEADSGKKALAVTAYLTGAKTDSFTTFPQQLEIRNARPQVGIRTVGNLPLYVNVAFRYFNPAPQPLSGAFSLRSWFTHGVDTVQALRHTDRCLLRTEVTVREDAEYVLVEVPIPAGCVPDRQARTYAYGEESREVFKDRVAIFCRRLPKGTWAFDVPLEARYKGSYSVNPARAEMMYFPDRQGHTAVRRVRVQ